MYNFLSKQGVNILYAAAVFMGLSFCVFFVTKRYIAPDYKESTAKLATLQYSDPDQALALAHDLIDEQPQLCAAYEIAANIYTLKKDFGAAEVTLRSAIDRCSLQPDLFVRLAHFYQRVSPEKLNPWIDSMLCQKRVKNSPILAARLLVIGQRGQEAIQILEAATDTNSYSFEVCMMLSRLYVREEKPEKAQELFVKFADSQFLVREKKAKLLNELFCLSPPFNRLLINACLRLIIQLADDETGFVACRRQLSENLNKLLPFDMQAHIGPAINENLNHSGSHTLWIWLKAIYLQRVKGPKVAYATLSDHHSQNIFLLEERARLAADVGDLGQVKRAWKKLFKVCPKDPRIRLEYAKAFSRFDLKAQSLKEAAKVNVAKIAKDLRWDYFALCLENDAALNRYKALVDTWAKAAKYYGYDDFLIFKDMIFANFKKPENYRSLLKALQQNRFEATRVAAAGELFKIFIAEKLKNPKLYFTAADKYLTLNTTYDARLIKLFVNTAIGEMAWYLRQGEKAPRHSQAAQFALKWSTVLANEHPKKQVYKYNQMISAYLAGKVSNLSQRCQKVLNGHKKDHHQLQLLAGKLSRIGCYDLAARYYQKALNLRPDMLRYRFNLAACLVNLEKYHQAQKIYISLIAESAARSWDMAAVLQHLWVCYDKLQRTDAFSAQMTKLAALPSVDKNKLRLTAGSLLLEKEQFEAAEAFLKDYLENTPKEENYDAYLKLAVCYTLQKKYNDAIGLYSSCLQTYRNDDLKQMDCLYNRAEIKRRKGDYNGAVKDWRQIARRYPNDLAAADSLLAAATVAYGAMHDISNAKELYQAYLALPQENQKMQHLVKEKLSLIRQAD